MFDEVYDGIYVGELKALLEQETVREEGISAVVRLDQLPRAGCDNGGGNWRVCGQCGRVRVAAVAVGYLAGGVFLAGEGH
jgi:hypothetical protein